MKSTGVVRQLDTLGRIVLPIELRRTMDIGVKDMLEIFVEDDSIILKIFLECLCIIKPSHISPNSATVDLLFVSALYFIQSILMSLMDMFLPV